MKIIREYPNGMKNIQYDHSDYEEIKKRFGSKLSNNTIEILCNYLKENNAVIDAKDCYDSQSGWSGVDFFIGNANLSLNGYCLSEASVLSYLNGEQNPMWYHISDDEYKTAKAWQEKQKGNRQDDEQK